MIILTQDQANQVRGYHALGHALAPVPLKNSATSNALLNGMLALPEECISDPYFAQFASFLQSLPTYLPTSRIEHATFSAQGPSGNTDYSIDSTVTGPCTYSASWQLGAIQSLPIVPPVAPAPNSDAQYLPFNTKQLAKAQSNTYWQKVYASTLTTQYLFAIWISQINSQCMGEVTTAQFNAVLPFLTTQELNFFNANKLAFNSATVVAFFNQNPPPLITTFT